MTTTKLLSPCPGAGSADRTRAAFQALDAYSGAISTYGDVTFYFDNVTGGLLHGCRSTSVC